MRGQVDEGVPIPAPTRPMPVLEPQARHTCGWGVVGPKAGEGPAEDKEGEVSHEGRSLIDDSPIVSAPSPPC
jgi:hypothetical protein